MHPVRLIGVACGLGAPDHGCADGPLFLRELKVFQEGNIPAAWEDMLWPNPANLESPIAAITELCSRLATHAQNVLEAGHFPLVVGRRSFLRHRHVERRTSMAGSTRLTRPDLDRRPHGQPYFRHHFQRSLERHAPGLFAGLW